MTDKRAIIQNQISKWDFPWQEMDVLIGGKSAIDLPQMSVADWSEATAFVLNYGYDADDPADQRTIQAVLIEAMNFIEQHLLGNDRIKLPIPKKLTKCEDIRNVILWASGQRNASKHLRLWSCAVLRVVHTIAHIEGVHRRVAVDIARQQIMSRFEAHLWRDENDRLWLGNSVSRVELESIEWKYEKSRTSMILKLLHKKANVAETIFDLLGARIVTKRLCDVVMVVKYLRQFYMITYANCNPGRARNNLIDMETFRLNTEMLMKMLQENRIRPEEFDELIEEMTVPSQNNGSSVNPHTQSTYKAVQLTCRQLIRSENPIFGWMNKLERWHSDHGDDSTAALLDYIRGWPGVSANLNLAVFFPFEVQVMDVQTYRANQYGDAAHDRYRQSQLRAARRRVLGNILRQKDEG